MIELESIRALLTSGAIAVVCGGGGIPVVARDGALAGVDAVIDKDRASALLAAQLGAERLLILTDVPALQSGFGTPQERELRRLSAGEAAELLPALAEGSMRPKVQASITFVRETGGTALVTSAAVLEEALAGRAGTTIS